MIMNKKVSTLLTLSLMLGGSLLASSAFAQNKLKIGDLATKLEAGITYHLVMDGKGTSDYAYGFDSYSLETGKITPCYAEIDNTNGTTDNADAYLWEVTESDKSSVPGTSEWVYTLRNVKTGQLLRFNTDGEAEMDTNVKDTDAKAFVAWAENGTRFIRYQDIDRSSVATGDAWMSTASQYDNETTPSYLDLLYSNLKVNTTTGYTFNLYEAADESVSDTELNKLYNSTGFNFTLGDDYEDVENIFNENKILAVQVEADVYPTNEYSSSSRNNYFPKGTYFVVKNANSAQRPRPLSDYSGDAQGYNNDMYNFLMDCEFIAVNPNDNKSEVANTRKSGEGFTLTTISARSMQFNLFAQTNKDIIAANEDKLPSGSEISVWNACFDVKKNASNSNKYAIALANFYVNETANASVQTMKKDHDLTIKSGTGYGAGEYLVTAAVPGYDYKFEFVESNAVAGTHFLNAEGPAIYNIRFVSGDSNDDESEYGKYLFAPAYDDAATSNLYAKGSALTDENMPEFQFVITEVQGTQVTFANRANDNVKFTVQLFDEGNNVYSLGYKSGTDEYIILDILNNGDIDAVDTKDLQLSKVVLETPASTDKFNGTWNVADETKVTLAFARDNTPTSNKVYPTAVYESNDFKFGTNTSETSEAAQWQLNKSAKPNYITRTYAFRVGEGENATVDYQIDGDTIAYYTYNMQLIVDGDVVKDRYLDINGTPEAVINNWTPRQQFIIKDNVDESVSLIVLADGVNAKNGYKTNSQVVIDGYTTIKNDISDYLKVGVGFGADALTQEPQAKYIKSYLLEEAPEVSWEGAGHVTLQSERGNYISMEEDSRDGIVVNNEGETLYLHMTDEDAVVPSFFISKGMGNGNAQSERMFLFNPEDSIDYYVADGVYDRAYQFSADFKKALFKAGTLDASCDTMTTEIKGKVATVAAQADNDGTQGGLNRFKFQIVETEDGDGLYYIRQRNANNLELTANNYAVAENYLISHNEYLSWGKKDAAMKFTIKEATAPTANEAISATDVKVIALDGAVNVKNAAGKNVVVSTILGQIVANEILTSDNATISVPAGIAIVSVDGEEAVKVSVK